MNNYIVKSPRDTKVLENTTREEVNKYIQEQIKKWSDIFGKELEREEKDLEFFYESQYDKMHILDREWFFTRGQKGLDDLEKTTKRGIENYKKTLEEVQNINNYRIFEEIK